MPLPLAGGHGRNAARFDPVASIAISEDPEAAESNMCTRHALPSTILHTEHAIAPGRGPVGSAARVAPVTAFTAIRHHNEGIPPCNMYGTIMPSPSMYCPPYATHAKSTHDAQMAKMQASGETNRFARYNFRVECALSLMEYGSPRCEYWSAIASGVGTSTHVGGASETSYDVVSNRRRRIKIGTEQTTVYKNSHNICDSR